MTNREIKEGYTEAIAIADSQMSYIHSLEKTIISLGGTEEQLMQIRSQSTDLDVNSYKKSSRLTMDRLMYVVCEYYDVDPRDVMGKRRFNTWVRARHLICFFAEKHLKHLTLKEIGRELGGRDHSTVIHGVKATSDRYDTEKRFREEFHELEQILGVSGINN